MHHIGASVKVLESDEAIEKFQTEMVEGFGVLPFSSFSLDVTRLSLDGIAMFLKHGESIKELSIVCSHYPSSVEIIRETYVNKLVGPKLARILTALSRSFRTLHSPVKVRG